MNVVALLVFVSLGLVAGAIVLFAYSVKAKDAAHADRLSLLPLEDDPKPPPTETP
jgi:cbb3-type cytochrome oxidase subunit 3